MSDYELISLYFFCIIIMGAHCGHRYGDCNRYVLFARIMMVLLFLGKIVEWVTGVKVL